MSMKPNNSTLLSNQQDLTPAIFCYTATFNPFCFENYTYPMGVGPPRIEVALKVLILTLIFMPSLMGNVVLVLVVATSRRLHTTTNFFLLNLGVVHLLVACFNMWTFLVYHLRWMRDPSYVAGLFYCNINRFVHIVALSCSSSTLTVIAWDRFFGVMCAMKAYHSQRRASVFICVVWLISVLVSLPMLLCNERQYRVWKDGVEVWCSEGLFSATPSHLGRKLYYISLFVVLYLIPGVLMTVAYSCIVHRLWRSRQPGDPECCGFNMAESRVIRQRQRVVRMLITMLAVYYVCWTPLQVGVFVDLFTSSSPKGDNVGDSGQQRIAWYKQYEFASHMLAYSNVSFYPVLFALYNQNFRKGTQDLVQRMFPCLRPPSLAQQEAAQAEAMPSDPQSSSNFELLRRTFTSTKGMTRASGYQMAQLRGNFDRTAPGGTTFFFTGPAPPNPGVTASGSFIPMPQFAMAGPPGSALYQPVPGYFVGRSAILM